jgi:hypothetical protein
MYTQDDVFFLKRSYEKHTTVTIINNTAQPKTFCLHCQNAVDLLEQQKPTGNLDVLSVQLPAYGGSIYLIEDVNG